MLKRCSIQESEREADMCMSGLLSREDPLFAPESQFKPPHSSAMAGTTPHTKKHKQNQLGCCRSVQILCKDYLHKGGRKDIQRREKFTICVASQTILQKCISAAVQRSIKTSIGKGLRKMTFTLSITKSLIPAVKVNMRVHILC